MGHFRQKDLLLRLLATAKELKKSSKLICGLITISLETCQFDLNCLLCSEVFDDILEFDFHINTSHVFSERCKKVLAKCNQNDEIGYQDEVIDESTAVSNAGNDTHVLAEDIPQHLSIDSNILSWEEEEVVTELEEKNSNEMKEDISPQTELEFLSENEEEIFSKIIEESKTCSINTQESTMISPCEAEEIATKLGEENLTEMKEEILPRAELENFPEDEEELFCNIIEESKTSSINSQEMTMIPKWEEEIVTELEEEIETELNEDILSQTESNNISEHEEIIFEMLEESKTSTISSEEMPMYTILNEDDQQFMNNSENEEFASEYENSDDEISNSISNIDDRKLSISIKTESGSESEENNSDKRYTLFSMEEADYLIDLYKENPKLWDKQKHKCTSTLLKSKIYAEITEAMQKKFNKQVTVDSVRNKIVTMRARLKRELHSMLMEKRSTSNLWFFDKMSFMIKNNNNEESDHLSSTEIFDLTCLQEFEEDKELNLDFIELFKSCPCLWNRQHPDYKNDRQSKESVDFLIKSMKNKWNLHLTEKLLWQKISIMYFLSNEGIIKKKSNNNSASCEQIPWYQHEISFLEKKKAENQIKQTNKVTCKMCQDTFRTERMLTNHINRKHIRTFKCEVCNKAYHNKNALKRHTYIHLDPEDRPFPCKFCGQKFADSVNRNVHERRHTKEFTHTCDVCNKYFYTISEVRIHMRIHTGEKPFVCEECGKPFRDKSEYLRHQRRHLGDRRHKCDICSKAFFNTETLRNHLTTHSDIRNHICDCCGKGFKSRNSLRQHKRVHSEQKKYECRICDRSYVTKAGLQFHMKTHGIIKMEEDAEDMFPKDNSNM